MKKELMKKFCLGVWGSIVLVLLISGVVLWWMLNSVFVDTSILTDLVKSIVEGEMSAAECTWMVFMVVFPIIVVVQILGGIIAMMATGEKLSLFSKKKK